MEMTMYIINLTDATIGNSFVNLLYQLSNTDSCEPLVDKLTS